MMACRGQKSELQIGFNAGYLTAMPWLWEQGLSLRPLG